MGGRRWPQIRLGMYIFVITPVPSIYKIWPPQTRNITPRGIGMKTDQKASARSEWTVLRCPSVKTLALEHELNERGGRAWAPACWISKRLPRKRARAWAMVPILPSYLFVEGDWRFAVRLLPWADRVLLKPMAIRGEYIVLADEALDGLRGFDNRVRPGEPGKPKPVVDPALPAPPVFGVGDHVVLQGILGGRPGVVIGKCPDGEYSVAIKNSPVRLKVSGFLIQEDTLYRSSSAP